MISEFYVSHFGFERIAFRGLETGNRNFATHVVKQGKIIFAFTSPYGAEQSGGVKGDYNDDVNEHLKLHGDGRLYCCCCVYCNSLVKQVSRTWRFVLPIASQCSKLLLPKARK